MTTDICYGTICFFHLDPSGPKFFGFSEFLTGLALMVLAWTIGDVRYRFRIRAAPVPLFAATYFIVCGVGFLTLVTDLWRAQGWLVPEGKLLSPALWQALLGGIFLLTFLAWAWFAFIRPPKFGRSNAERFAKSLYRHIIKGDPAELSVIADELASSAEALVRHAPDRYRHGKQADELPEGKVLQRLTNAEGYAHDLLLLIADKRLCRAIIDSSPITALAIFEEINDQGKYGIAIETFSKNIVREALSNPNSFLYHETDAYESGLIGHLRPLSQAMFSNPKAIESIDSLLDPDLLGKRKWSAVQWDAYCRLVLVALQGYADAKILTYSRPLRRATDYLTSATSDLYTVNGLANSYESEPVQKLQAIMNFTKEAVKILDEHSAPKRINLRIKVAYGHPYESIYDDMASIIFETIHHASCVKSPWWDCWSIQHNMIWSKLQFALAGPAGRAIRHKLHRIVYNEIIQLENFPNFKSSPILAYCLNVLGLVVPKGDFQRECRPLHKAILAWTKRNYSKLHANNPRVAEACLPDRITYDAKSNQLVKTYPAEGLRNEPKLVYLQLDPAS
ncbi:hypothetical protein [Pseudomonas sp. Leaf58]|uniref:hypothetical protein n=1 Tax=Pseudomonas sp. Leaf58 TaxID=1736226 RepID=UPI000AC18281|nr:hypothetical protein [Pseudomonas sp. Leaf58]